MRARQAGHPRRDEARDEARRDRPTHLGEADARATPRDRRPAAPGQTAGGARRRAFRMLHLSLESLHRSIFTMLDDTACEKQPPLFTRFC